MFGSATPGWAPWIGDALPLQLAVAGVLPPGRTQPRRAAGRLITITATTGDFGQHTPIRRRFTGQRGKEPVDSLPVVGAAQECRCTPPSGLYCAGANPFSCMYAMDSSLSRTNLLSYPRARDGDCVRRISPPFTASPVGPSPGWQECHSKSAFAQE